MCRARAGEASPRAESAWAGLILLCLDNRDVGSDDSTIATPDSGEDPLVALEFGEPLTATGVKNGRDIVRDVLDKVHLPADSRRRLAREFSGAQRQRIAIARALALHPRLIICDEPALTRKPHNRRAICAS